MIVKKIAPERFMGNAQQNLIASSFRKLSASSAAL
jgi:hypothetical protein